MFTTRLNEPLPVPIAQGIKLNGRGSLEGGHSFEAVYPCFAKASQGSPFALPTPPKSRRAVTRTRHPYCKPRGYSAKEKKTKLAPRNDLRRTMAPIIILCAGAPHRVLAHFAAANGNIPRATNKDAKSSTRDALSRL